MGAISGSILQNSEWEDVRDGSERKRLLLRRLQQRRQVSGLRPFRGVLLPNCRLWGGSISQISQINTAAKRRERKKRVKKIIKFLWGNKIVKFNCFYLCRNCYQLCLSLFRFQVETGKIHVRFLGHKAFVYSLNWSSDDHCLLSASTDQTARIWDVRNQIVQHIEVIN